MILLNTYSYHRDPEVFPNPDEFNPDRWNDSKATQIAWGFGQRACFGKKFAIMELKTMVFLLLQQYEILPGSKPLELWIEFGLKPKKEAIIRVRKL
jgi:cytochrome P450